MTTADVLAPERAEALLRWYADSGVMTAESVDPALYADWPAAGFRANRPPDPVPEAPRPSARPKGVAVTAEDGPMPTDEAIALAEQTAAAATDLPALIDAIMAFEGCPLKGGARTTVVYDGQLEAPILVLGEAPGRDEDRVGKPFVGRAGALLDRMLGAIGVARSPTDGQTPACITNAIYWRPPGNRTPTKAEVAICLPFVRRFIDLSAPRLILTMGNVPTQALFPSAPGITRSRGKWQALTMPSTGDVPVLPMFHPAFLLRQPGQKRAAWADLLAAKEKIHQG